MAAAVLGGAVSHYSGGSFANGAMTAAFVHAYNYGLHEGKGECGLSECVEVTLKDGSKISVAPGMADKVLMADARNLQVGDIRTPTAIEGIEAVGTVADIITVVAPNPVTPVISTAADVGAAYMSKDVTKLQPTIVGGSTTAILKGMGNSYKTSERAGVVTGALYGETQD